MKYFFLIAFICLPGLPGTLGALAVQDSAVSHTAVCAPVQVEKKGSIFKRIGQKMLFKGVKKAFARYQNTDGIGLGIAGLILALSVVPMWFINPYLGLFTTIPIAGTGLLLSLFAWKKARNWNTRRSIKVLAIAGIVLNSLLLLAFACLMLWSG